MAKHKPARSLDASARDFTFRVCAFLVVIVFAVFSPALRAGFLNYDDNLYVYDNPAITAGLSFRAIGWAFTHIHADNWHPVTTISHMLDCQIYGLQPWGHHLTNILLHALAAVFLFLALLRLTALSAKPSTFNLPPSTFFACAFVAALFAVHPLRVESVAWISERKDVLSGVFFMLTLWAYAGYARAEQRRVGKYLLVVLSFALGLMCKPTLVTVPFVLLLLDYWPLNRMRRPRNDNKTARQQDHKESDGLAVSGHVVSNLVVEKIPLFVLSIASCIVTVFVQKEALDTMGRLTFQERFANAVLSYVIYLGQLVYPAHLTPLNPYTQTRPSSLAIIIALTGLWLITLAFFVWRKRFPFLSTGWLWYVGMLVPMSGIVQVGRQTHADRYTYLAQIGLYIAVTWSALKLINPLRRRLLATSALIIVAALGTISYFQTRYWKDSDTLWTQALSLDDKNYVAHNNLGNLVMERGNVDEAIRHFQAATEADPTYAEGHYNLGNAWAGKNRYIEAIASYKAAIEARPKFYQARNNMACMLVNIGKTDEAIVQFNEALRIHSDYRAAHLNLGQLLNRLGRTDEGAAHLAEAARLQSVPNDKTESLTVVRPGN